MNERTLVSTQNLTFINIYVIAGYNQILRQVSSCVGKFFELGWTCIQHNKFGLELLESAATFINNNGIVGIRMFHKMT